ncbi:MAG: efflux RND transporter permease subunit [Ignavibacteriota bacterium]|nr:efflux RND transporter permease subunit [Ignavibacteriota bacterium]
MTLTEIAIKRPTLVVVIFSFLAVLGVFGFNQLKYELMPKMTAPIVTVTTIYPGGSPNEVENSVTKVIEDAISGVESITSVRSSSSEGRSMVIVELEATVNVDISLQDVQRKVNEVSDKLPQTSRKPVISKIALDEIPVLRMAVKGNLESREFYQFVKDKIQPRLASIGGVGQVGLLGGDQREIKVNMDYQKLKAYNLSVPQITQVIKSSNVDFPTGNIKDTDDQFVIRVEGKFVTPEEMRNLVVMRSKNGGIIRLSDVAEVQDGRVDYTNLNRLNGVSSIGILVQKTSDGNTVDVSAGVRKELTKLENDYKSLNLQFNIAQDGSIFTMDSANAVKEDLAIAVVLVAVVMLIFLHSLRNSIIVMVAIPASLVSTFFLMYVFDFSLNLMTLLGMSLVIGILVDDSIVVLENIYTHLEMGEGQQTAALKGRNEIGFAALSITLVDVVVFVPLALITGMIGNFLRQYALVVVFSTLMSLFVSFTVTPMLASRFTKLEHLTKKTLMGRFGLWFEKLFQGVTNYYTSVLKWSLGHGKLVGLLILILLVFSVMLPKMGFIGSEFMPVVDRGEFIITIETAPGSSIENTNYATQRVEKILKDIPEVEKVITNVGASSEGLLGVYSNNSSELNIVLVDKNKRAGTTEGISQDIKNKILKIPGIKVRVNPISLFGTQNRSPVQILISGANYEDVMKGARIMYDITKGLEGTSDVRLSSEEGKPELRIQIDREKMALLGLTINDVGQTLRIALTGDNDSKYRQGVNEYDIRILADESDRTNTSALPLMGFMNTRGQMIQLNQFANIYQTTGPTKLERENRISSITLFSQVYGKTSGEVGSAITEKMKSIPLPPGVSFSFTGEQKTMADSFKSLIYAILAAILFVYMIMVALYDSYVYPFVVLFSIPVAIIGAFLGLALTAKTISLYSMLGMIMLIGLVAKNAILIVDRANQMKLNKNMSTYDALVEAGQARLRPILMTTVAMVVGMLPIAVSTSAGSEAKSGLGMVLIGGLTSSLVLTLVLVPVVYQRFDKWKASLANRKERRRLKAAGLVEKEIH